ncbi:MFS transporter [bacterium]|nr:MFS transporter [bacterium]
MQSTTNEKLSLVAKLGFGIGDIYGGGSLLIIGFYYLYFLTDVLLITPALAGAAFFVSKTWDAVSDPLMGIITDRTKSRFGRRRPYFLAGVILIFFSFFMLWFPVDFEKEMHRFAYVLCAYLVFSTVLTLVMVPYNALSSELTLDYDERTNLTSFRIFFSSVSSLICAVVPMKVVRAFPDVRLGYIVMAISFGLFFALPFLAVFFTTKERKEFQEKTTSLDIYKIFVKPFKTPTFINVLFMYLFAFVAMDVVMAIMIYFMTYYLGRGAETENVLGTLLVLQIIALPIFAKISEKTDKRTGYLLGTFILLGVMFIGFLITPDMPKALIYIFAALAGLGTGGIIIMIYSIFPDLPDIDELYTGERREGVYSGIITFSRKVSSAVAIFGISSAISIAGYKAPVKETVDGVTKMIQQQQNPDFFLILRFVFVCIPSLFILLCIYNAIRFRLTKSSHGELKQVLEIKRSKESNSISENGEQSLKDFLERR